MNRVTLTVFILAVSAVATARADMLYVSVNTKIVEYDTTSPTPTGTVFTTTGVQPNSGLAFDSASNLYVAMYTTGAIQKYAPNGTGSGFAGFNGVGYGMAINGANNLFVADGNNHLIREISPAGVVTDFGTVAGVPFGLAFDSHGNLFVASSNNSIIEFTPGGTSSVFATVGISQPIGLAFDAAGNLFVANSGNNTILRIHTRRHQHGVRQFGTELALRPGLRLVWQPVRGEPGEPDNREVHARRGRHPVRVGLWQRLPELPGHPTRPRTLGPGPGRRRRRLCTGFVVSSDSEERLIRMDWSGALRTGLPCGFKSPGECREGWPRQRRPCLERVAQGWRSGKRGQAPGRDGFFSESQVSWAGSQSPFSWVRGHAMENRSRPSGITIPEDTVPGSPRSIIQTPGSPARPAHHRSPPARHGRRGGLWR